MERRRHDPATVVALGLASAFALIAWLLGPWWLLLFSVPCSIIGIYRFDRLS